MIKSERKMCDVISVYCPRFKLMFDNSPVKWRALLHRDLNNFQSIEEQVAKF